MGDHPDNIHIESTDWLKAFISKSFKFWAAAAACVGFLLVPSDYVQMAGVIGLSMACAYLAPIVLDIVKKETTWVMARKVVNYDSTDLSVEKLELHEVECFNPKFWDHPNIITKEIIWFTPRTRIIVKIKEYK